jgi:hypothetical protein
VFTITHNDICDVGKKYKKYVTSPKFSFKSGKNATLD